VAAVRRPAEDIETVDIADTARRVWTTVSNGEGTLDIATDLTVECDPDVVTILFERLFENALAHDGDDVTVTLGDTDDGFFVADDGPGVPDDAKPRVFEQGYGTAREGEGYGLFVASRVAAANGWAITVGDSDDGGARFDVRYR
jgi:signal transduction histidine kinase